MTDIEALFAYRLRQAVETLQDAERMLDGHFSARSTVNRAYYAMFYSVLALFLKHGTKIRTSKHSGVISVFDKEFVHTGRIDKRFSRMLHRVFEERQEVDYKEFVELTHDDASEAVKFAREFLDTVKRITDT